MKRKLLVHAHLHMVVPSNNNDASTAAYCLLVFEPEIIIIIDVIRILTTAIAYENTITQNIIYGRIYKYIKFLPLLLSTASEHAALVWSMHNSLQEM